MKSILIKNYYYFRSKKYNKNSKVFLYFRVHYAKRIPKVVKYSKITPFSSLFLQQIFRSFYSNYLYYYTSRIKKFWNYFFTFFLQNIKKRFFILNYKDNINNNYLYDLLLFLKKFIFFNRFLRRYFNSYNYKKKFNLLKNKKNNENNNFINFLFKRVSNALLLKNLLLTINKFNTTKKVKIILYKKLIALNKKQLVSKLLTLNHSN